MTLPCDYSDIPLHRYAINVEQAEESSELEFNPVTPRVVVCRPLASTNVKELHREHQPLIVGQGTDFRSPLAQRRRHVIVDLFPVLRTKSENVVGVRPP